MTLGRVYLVFLGALLIAYAFLSKGFAYVGYASLPIYVGEVALAFSIFIFVIGGVRIQVFRSPIAWMILLFVFWGALGTLPYIGKYGLLALRDGVVWGYAAFALVSAGVLLRAGGIHDTMVWYGIWSKWFVAWCPVAFLVYTLSPGVLPVFPGSAWPLLVAKAGDFSVHLAGAGAFMALGLHEIWWRSSRGWIRATEWGWWIVWGIGFLALGAKSRGALLTLVCTLAVVVVFHGTSRYLKILLVMSVVGAAFLIANVAIPLDGGRQISPGQIIANIESLAFRSNQVELHGTAEWRLQWWRAILDYTVFGDYFWTGKGYGINLANSDGFQVIFDGAPLRSPHNGHVTVLARSGVPGFAIWILLQLIVLVTLLQGYSQARKSGEFMLAKINLWLLAYWAAFVVNASFDVYLEAPQGGIWFWCLLGYIIAFNRWQQHIIQSGKDAAILGYREAVAGG